MATLKWASQMVGYEHQVDVLDFLQFHYERKTTLHEAKDKASKIKPEELHLFKWPQVRECELFTMLAAILEQRELAAAREAQAREEQERNSLVQQQQMLEQRTQELTKIVKELESKAQRAKDAELEALNSSRARAARAQAEELEAMSSPRAQFLPCELAGASRAGEQEVPVEHTHEAPVPQAGAPKPKRRRRRTTQPEGQPNTLAEGQVPQKEERDPDSQATLKLPASEPSQSQESV